jgi:hypothetical protein
MQTLLAYAKVTCYSYITEAKQQSENEMITGNPSIDAKFEMDIVLSDYENTCRSKFLVGNDVIENYAHKVEIVSGRLNFKVKKNPSYKNSYQVTFSDCTWLLYSVSKGVIAKKCGNVV